MSKDEWRKVWVDTLVEAGILFETAEDMFDACYTNQEIDLGSDPVSAACVFIPMQSHCDMYLDEHQGSIAGSSKSEKRK